MTTSYTYTFHKHYKDGRGYIVERKVTAIDKFKGHCEHWKSTRTPKR